MIEDDIPDNPYMTDPDGDWTNRMHTAVVSAIVMAVIGMGLGWLLGLPWNWG